MTDLPPSWEWTTLGEVCGKLQYGWTSKAQRSPVGLRMLRTTDIARSTLQWEQVPTCTEEPEDRERFLLRAGDIVISRAGSVGVSRLLHEVPVESVFASYLIRARPIEIDPHFLAHYLNSSGYWDQIHEMSAGIGMSNINARKLSELRLPLPPLAEQLRIVRETEQHLTATDQAARTVGTVRERSRTLGEASVRDTLYPPTMSPHAAPPTASFTSDGDLPSIPKEWSWQRLGDVAEVVGGVTKDSSKQSDPTVPLVPYLRVANVQRGRLDLSQLAHIRATQRQVDKLTLRPGDVLLNEGGDRDKLGRGWVWEGQIENCIHQNHVFRARVRDRVIHPKLLAWHANNFGQWFERNGKQSVNLASISLTTIKQLPVPVPPRELQEEMVVEIEGALAGCSRLHRVASHADARASALRTSILHAAFTGELTRQDPTDEPASVLLERIRAERAGARPTRSSRRRPTRSPTR